MQKSAFGVEHPRAIAKGLSPKTAIRTADLKKIPKEELAAVRTKFHANNPPRQSLVKNPQKKNPWLKTISARRDKV